MTINLQYIKTILEKRVETLNNQKTFLESQGMLDNIINVENEITEVESTIQQIDLINE